MTQRTNEELIEIAKQVTACAASWEPEARLIGNVRAIDLRELAMKFIDVHGELEELKKTMEDMALERTFYDD